VKIGRGIVAVVAGLVLTSIVPLAARAAPANTGTGCAWPARLDPTAFNTLYPDSSANYWITDLPAVPGETLTITGQYPHARYMSFTSYTPYLFSADGLHDTDIAADPGSSNPFLPGADRTVTNRNYTVTVVFGQRPATPAPNTLYTTSADGSRTGASFLLAYRVYVPDAGQDERGGVALPQITANTPGGQHVPIPACGIPGTPDNGVNDAVAKTSFPWPAVAPWPGTNPPTWHRFYNGLTSAATLTDNGVTGTQISDGMTGQITQHSSRGGFLDNPDNAYVYAMLSRGYGPVAVVHAQAPTFADTSTATVMPSGEQLRYWSICSYEIATERYYGCVRDDQMQVDPTTGMFTLVVSDAANRPACATNWLPFGPASESLLIVRHMLPDPSFANAVQNIPPGGSVQATMGPYFPDTHYSTTC
jgi:hypothetical protein